MAGHTVHASTHQTAKVAKTPGHMKRNHEAGHEDEAKREGTQAEQERR